MTTSVLSRLLGQFIVSVEVIHDYLQVTFSNGDLLNVFNVYLLEGVGQSGIRELIGLRVCGISDQTHEVRLDLGAHALKVSLADEAFRGPEAMEYVPVSGSRIVW